MSSMSRIALVAALLIAACTAPTATMSPDTPDDLAILASSVFEEFVGAFPAKASCIGEVEIGGVWELPDRARYHPAYRRIEVRIPATAPHLTASLVHELGHHLEHACPDQVDVRSSFLAALDLDPDTDWRDASSYETTPSELWAEAVVRHVTGETDTRRPLPVTQDAVRVVGEWAEG